MPRGSWMTVQLELGFALLSPYVRTLVFREEWSRVDLKQVIFREAAIMLRAGRSSHCPEPMERIKHEQELIHNPRKSLGKGSQEGHEGEDAGASG